jgi:predicted NUDIX family NTP pyrophosphohydrolase
VGDPGTRSRLSAGILLFRHGPDGRVEVLLAHPGGPLYTHRDRDTWSIPKGEVRPGETLEEVARREFLEETGHPVEGELLPLGEVIQKGGKRVVAWAVEGDLDPAHASSNTFAMQWPPGSGRYLEIPEIDRVEWFDTLEARTRIKERQIPFIDRLEVLLVLPDAVAG